MAVENNPESSHAITDNILLCCPTPKSASLLHLTCLPFYYLNFILRFLHHLFFPNNVSRIPVNHAFPRSQDLFSCFFFLAHRAPFEADNSLPRPKPLLAFSWQPLVFSRFHSGILMTDHFIPISRA